MNSDILYFPYINIPKNDWTIRALMYYDKIGTIIPHDYFTKPNILDPFMLELSQAGYIQFIDPMSYISDPNAIVSPFIEFITHDERSLENKRRNFKSSVHKSFDISKLKFSRPIKNTEIFSQKFDSDMFAELQKLKLAKRINDYSFSVEENTAMALMTYLASILGKCCNMVPATDSLTNLETPISKLPFRHKQLLRDKILERILPYPEKIDVQKFLKFKEDNSEDIELFRIKIENLIVEVTSIDDAEYLENKLREIEIHSDNLAERMKSNKFGRIVWGSFCGLAAGAIGLASSGTSGLLLGVPGFANSIYSALESIKPNAISDISGLKYLALLRWDILKSKTN